MGGILIAGGGADPNVSAVMDGAARAGVRCVTALTGAVDHPVLQWDLTTDQLLVNGREVLPAAVFLRHDIFDQLASGDTDSGVRALAWYGAVIGWVHAHPDVRILNRGSLLTAVSKASNLMLAKACGLAVPATVVTNDVNWLAGFGASEAVVKPLVDGGYCEPAEQVLANCEAIDGAAAQPAFVQERLVPPELRIYRIGSRWFAFHVESSALDYRTDRNVVLKRMPLEPYGHLIAGAESG